MQNAYVSYMETFLSPIKTKELLNYIEEKVKNAILKGIWRVTILIPRADDESSNAYKKKLGVLGAWLISERYYSRTVMDSETGLSALEVAWNKNF